MVAYDKANMETTLLIATQQPGAGGPPFWIVASLATAAVLIVMGIFAWINRAPRETAGEQPQIELPILLPYVRQQPVRVSAADLDDNYAVNNVPTVVIDRAPRVENGATSVPLPVTQSVGLPIAAKPRSPEILIGYDVGDEHQDVYAALGHTLVARRSGGGKSNILALLVSGLLDQGVEVWYANAKYMPISYNKQTGKKELDIGPMVNRCHRAEVQAKDLSRGRLNMLLDAQTLVHDRIELSQGPNAPEGDFPPVAIVFDELKAAQSDWRRLERAGVESARTMAGEAIETVLTKGRQAQVFFITTGQDAQVQSLGVSQGTMVNFMLRIAHPSLDNASLVNLMPKGIRRDELPKTTSPFQWYVTTEGEMGSDIVNVVDVPLVTQTWLTERLKSVTVKRQPTCSPPNESKADEPTQTPDAPANDASGGDDEMPENMNEKLALVVAWLRREPNITPAEVARRLWLGAAERPAGQGVGSYGVKAKKLLDDARAVLQRSAEQGTVTDTPDGLPEKGDDLRLSGGEN